MESGIEEQAVLIHVPEPEDPDTFGIDLLEDPIIEALGSAGVGEFDGNLTGPDETVLYLYGPDADALLLVVVEALKNAPVPSGTYVMKRYGEPGAREERIELTP